MVLGTFPSEKSLELEQYYGNPRNHFWRIISEITGFELVRLTYRERTEALLKVGIGLWDVISSCERAGSLDSAIVKPIFNVIDAGRFASLALVCFNGKKAASWGRKLVTSVRTLHLPSTSPANARISYRQKLDEWSQIKAYI